MQSDLTIENEKDNVIIYNDIFRRKLSINWIFFTKIGVFMLALYLYQIFETDISFVRASLFLLFGVLIVTRFFYNYRFFEKRNILVFSIKGNIMKRYKTLSLKKKEYREYF